MNPSDMNTRDNKRKQLDQFIKMIRIGGTVLLIAGLTLLSNVGDLAAAAGLDNDIRIIIGGFLCLIGVTEFLILPRIFEASFNKKNPPLS